MIWYAIIMAAKKKCRQYSLDYLKFGFVPSPFNEQRPMCLICQAVFSNEAMKPSRLREHLYKMHAEKANEGLNFFKRLKQQHDKQATVVGLLGKNPHLSTKDFWHPTIFLS